MTSRPNSERRRRYRRQLAARDGARCFYCNRRFRDLAAATIDHLVPTYHGGTWARANLVLACSPCNEAKGHRMPTEFLRSRGYRPGLRPSRTALLRRRAAALLTRPASGLRWRTPGGPPADRTEHPVRPRRSGLGTALAVVPALLLLAGTVTRT